MIERPALAFHPISIWILACIVVACGVGVALTSLGEWSVLRDVTGEFVSMAGVAVGLSFGGAAFRAISGTAQLPSSRLLTLDSAILLGALIALPVSALLCPGGWAGPSVVELFVLGCGIGTLLRLFATQTRRSQEPLGVDVPVPASVEDRLGNLDRAAQELSAAVSAAFDPGNSAGDSICLQGGWGAGKSSVLRRVLENAAEVEGSANSTPRATMLTVVIEPWLLHEPRALVERLVTSIPEALSRRWFLPQLSRDTRAYLALLHSLRYLPLQLDAVRDLLPALWFTKRPSGERVATLLSPVLSELFDRQRGHPSRAQRISRWWKRWTVLSLDAADGWVASVCAIVGKRQEAEEANPIAAGAWVRSRGRAVTGLALGLLGRLLAALRSMQKWACPSGPAGVLVVIDEIDRLGPREIALVLRYVGSLSSVPFTAVVVSGEGPAMVRALVSHHGLNSGVDESRGDEALTKFFSRHVIVPDVDWRDQA